MRGPILAKLGSSQLSELIGAIYDCAIDPDRWVATLGQIRTLLGAENAVLSLIDLRRNAFMLNFLDNVPEAWSKNIERWGGEIINAWGGVELFRSMSLDVPFIWSRAISRLPQSSNSFVDEVTSAGFGDSMSLVLARDDGVVGACGFGRMRKAGPFTEEELELAQMLLPHLQRAIAFSRLLELATLRSTALEAALDTVAAPTILVNDRLQMVHANRAARAVLERGAVLQLAGGRLAATDLRDDGALRRALVKARDEPHAAPAGFDISLGPSAGHLKLLPLSPGSARSTLAPSATAAIVIPPTAGADRMDRAATVQWLIDRHGLTRAEAAVALEIAQGDGRAAAAARLGIRDNTVRSHLSAIFAKLNINRQAQLIRLIDGHGTGT